MKFYFEKFSANITADSINMTQTGVNRAFHRWVNQAAGVCVCVCVCVCVRNRDISHCNRVAHLCIFNNFLTVKNYLKREYQALLAGSFHGLF